MNRGIIIAAAAISMAGAASAHLLTGSSQGAAAPQGAATRAPVGHAAPLASATRLAEPPTEPGAKPAPSPVQRKASLEVRQAPVPMQVKPRAPVNLPAADITEANAKGEAGPPTKANASASALSETGDQPGAAAARAAIEADGYKGVQMLRKGEGGAWHAKALRGKTEVLLVVDSRGSVTTAN